MERPAKIANAPSQISHKVPNTPLEYTDQTNVSVLEYFKQCAEDLMKLSQGKILKKKTSMKKIKD